MLVFDIVKTNRVDTTDPTLWLKRHGDYLYGYAFFRLHDETSAEDMVQETLLAALQSRQTFANLSTERTWLTAILKHKIVDFFRHVCRETNFDGLDETDNWEEQFFDETGHWRETQCPNEWNSDAEFLFEQKEFLEILQQCLANLPKRLACVFTLREIEGLSGTEICRMLKISPNNLWTMLHRARIQLRYWLEMNWFKNESDKVMKTNHSERQNCRIEEQIF